MYIGGVSPGGAANRVNIALEGDDGRESPGPRVNSSSRRYENRDRSSATSLPGPARREACEAYIRLEAFFGGLAGIDGRNVAPVSYAASLLCSLLGDFRPKNSGPDQRLPVIVRAICDTE